MKIIQISQRQIHCAFSFAISPSNRYQKRCFGETYCR